MADGDGLLLFAFLVALAVVALRLAVLGFRARDGVHDERQTLNTRTSDDDPLSGVH